MPLPADERELILIGSAGLRAVNPADGAKPTPRALAGAVAELLREIGIDRAHVAGNSLGGWVGLELALRGAVLSVTAIAPAGLYRPGSLLSAAHLLARRLLPLVGPMAASSPGRRLLLRWALRPTRLGASCV